MSNWYDFLGNGLLLTGCALALRELLIAIVVIWSMCSDEKGRDHALKLLKILRVQLRQPPPEVPPPHQIAPAQPPPPQVPGPTGGAAV